jgi:hypothetical protein
MKAKGRWQEQVGSGDYWRWQNCERPQFLAALDTPAPAMELVEAWQPIETAPPLDRVLVAGWQEPSGRTAGYWWYYEDMTDEKARPTDHPTALQWRPWPKPPQVRP